MAKIGQGHLGAMARLGLKEIAQVLPAFPGQGVHLSDDPALLGNQTQRGAYEATHGGKQTSLVQQATPVPKKPGAVVKEPEIKANALYGESKIPETKEKEKAVEPNEQVVESPAIEAPAMEAQQETMADRFRAAAESAPAQEQEREDADER